METIIAAAAIILMLVLIALQFKHQMTQQPTIDIAGALAPLNQSIGSIRSDFLALQGFVSTQLASAAKLTSDTVQASISNIITAVEGNQASLLKSTGQVGERLDNAASVIGEVKTKLGELQQATKEIKDLGQSVSSLQQLLQAPKLRGGFGEMLLEDLLKQVLPQENFDIQHRIRSGNTVDAFIRTSAGGISVDSKFPFENFKRAMQAPDEASKRASVRLFISDVKKHVDAIASKYILPDEGTFSFAIMYIPIESIYYELVIRDGSIDKDGEVQNYALGKHVLAVSPSSFYAYLTAIAYGLKGLQIEKSAQVIINGLARIQGDVDQFSQIYTTLGNHLKNAVTKFDDGDKKLSGVGQRITNLTSGASDGKNQITG